MSEAHPRLGRHAQLGGVVIELKHGRPADQVVGQVSRYLGWVAEEYARRGETAAGAIVARDADRKLRRPRLGNTGIEIYGLALEESSGRDQLSLCLGMELDASH